MKNVVNFETAKRLKQASFPQPEKWELLQCWYSKNGLLIVNHFAPENPPLLMKYFKDKGYVFAPTSADILRELFPADKKVILGAMDVLQIALDPETAAERWIKKNEK